MPNRYSAIYSRLSIAVTKPAQCGFLFLGVGMALGDLILAVRNLQQANERLEDARKRKKAAQDALVAINDEIDRAQLDLQAAKTAAKQIANDEL